MSIAADYAYLDARVSVMTERLLSAQALRHCFDQDSDEQQQALQRAGLPKQTLDAPALEQSLITILVDEATLLARPLSGPAHELLSYWMRRFELINLKVILRGVLARQKPELIKAELLDLGGMAVLPVEQLIHATDIAELLRILEKSAYASMARQARSIFETQPDWFRVEAALDREYFAGLAKRAGILPEADGRYLRRLTGTLIDQMNLLWLLRYRLTYGLTSAHTYFLLAPAGHHLGSKQLLQLVQKESLDEVIAALPAALNRHLAECLTIEDVEREMRRESEEIAHFLLTHTTFNLARPCAYLLLRERQLWQFHALLKGSQLQLTPELMRHAARLTDAAPNRRATG